MTSVSTNGNKRNTTNRPKNKLVNKKLIKIVSVLTVIATVIAGFLFWRIYTAQAVDVQLWNYSSTTANAVYVDDLNNDGINETIYVGNDADIHVVTVNASTRQYTDNLLNVNMPGNANIIRTANIDGAGNKEIVVAASGGTWFRSYTWNGGTGFTQLYGSPTTFNARTINDLTVGEFDTDTATLDIAIATNNTAESMQEFHVSGGNWTNDWNVNLPASPQKIETLWLAGSDAIIIVGGTSTADDYVRRYNASTTAPASTWNIGSLNIGGTTYWSFRTIAIGGDIVNNANATGTDGVDEVIIGTQQRPNGVSDVVIALNGATGATAWSYQSGTQVGRINDLKVIDIDNNGTKDFIIAGAGQARNGGGTAINANYAMVFKITGSGFNTPNFGALGNALPGEVHAVAGGSFNGDGKLHLAAMTGSNPTPTADNKIYVYEYDGVSTLTQTITRAMNTTALTQTVRSTYWMTAGTINYQDDNPDIAYKGPGATGAFGVSMDNKAPNISTPTPAPQDISDVTGATYGPTSTFNVSVNESAYVSVKVYSDAARTNLISTVASVYRVDRIIGASTWVYAPTWNGSGNTGSGTYYYSIIATDNENDSPPSVNSTNTSVYDTGYLELDLTAPTATITTPAVDGATVSGTINIEGTAADDYAPHFLEYSVDYEQFGVGNWTPVGANPRTTAVTGGILAASWDTTSPMLNGDYRIRLTVKDKYGHTTVAYRRVNIVNDTTGPDITLSYFKDDALSTPLTLDGSTPITTIGSVYAKVYSSELMNSAPKLTISGTTVNDRTNMTTTKVSDYVYKYKWDIVDQGSSRATATVAVAAYDLYNNQTDNATQVTGKNVIIDTFANATTVNSPTFSGGSVHLTWSPPAQNDAFEYRIWRKLGSAGVDTSGPPYWTVTSAAYDDPVGTVTQSIYYVVKVVDIVYNSSLASNEVYVTAPEPTTLTVTSNPVSVVANDTDTSTITAHLTDQYGNAVSGQQINFTKDQAWGTFSAASAVTNGSGDATVTIRSASTGTVTITGTVNSKPSVTDTATVDFTPLADSIVMNAAPGNIAANNTTTSTVTADPRSGGSSLAGGTVVHFTITGGTFSDGTVDKYVATDLITKLASVQVKSGSVGTIVVTAQAAGASNTQNVTVDARVVSSVTVSAAPTTIKADNIETSTITATVFDQAGVIMGNGITVNFSATPPGTLSASSAVTASGVATVTVKAGSPGSTTVTASSNGQTDDVVVNLEVPDNTPPTLFKAELTSKQLLYLTFSESIQYSNPVNWYVYKFTNGAYSGTVPYNSTTELVTSDKRIVRVTVNESTYGNLYYNPVRYQIIVSGVKDLNNNVLDAVYNSAYFDPYSPHGKYAKVYTTDVSNTRLCGQCHIAHSAVGKQLLNKETIKKVCFICHGTTGISEYKVESEFTSRTANGSVVSYSLHKSLDVDNQAGNDIIYCTDCHNPHGDKRTGNDIYPKLLKAADVAGTVYYQGNGYCLACHGADGKLFKTGNSMSVYYATYGGDHRWGMDVNGNKDVAGAAYIPHYDRERFAIMDPASGTQIACLKCHERHGSQYRSLSDNSRTNAREDLCYKCHNTTTPNSMSVDVQAKFGLSSKHNILDPSNIGLTCSSCHGPHSVARRTFASSTATLPSDISDPTNTKSNYNTTSGNFAGYCNKCHHAANRITVTQTTNSSTVIPYSVTLPSTSFTSSGTGWNKKQYYDANSGNTNAGHYVQNIMCDKCHDPHGSSNPRLMTLGEDPSTAPTTTSGLCLRCHGGGATPAGPNVWTNQFAVSGAGTSEHPTLSNGSVIHSDDETIYSTTSDMVRHAECYDCHDPHAAKNGTAEIDPIRGATGVSINWGAYTWSNYNTMPRTNFSLVTLDGTAGKTNQYQVCMKCHSKYAYRPVTANGETTLRAPHTNLSDATFNQTDVAREFNPNVKSKHIVVPGQGYTNIRATDGNFSGSWSDGRQLTLTRSSVLKCTDCHTAATGSIRGPHGSTNKFLLIAPWNPTGASGTKTGTAGTGTHLCFRCHSFSFYTGTTGTSAFSDGNNLHGKSDHATAGCASCHGGLPHGWSYANATYGVPMFKTTDPPPYNTGAWLSNFSLQNPGSWGGQHGGTGCTLSGCSG